MAATNQKFIAELWIRGSIAMSSVVIDGFANAIFVVVYISLIPLSASMTVGLVLGVLQAVTQIQEQSLTFVAKILSATSALYFTRGYWIVELEACFIQSFDAISEI